MNSLKPSTIRIQDALSRGKSFLPFITAGDPNLEKTKDFILTLEKAGADVIELGIPFSDPIAEGTVIQEADLRALNSGTTITKIFKMIEDVRKETDIPLVFMTYLNPVFYFGYDAFFSMCKEKGIDGVIIPDLPYEEKHEVLDVANKYGITFVSLIAPTSNQRIGLIAKEAEGFVYVVSSLGVTGVRKEITSDLGSMINTIKEVSDIPAIVGFGINTTEQAKQICEVADGVIVGSSIVKIIEKHKEEADTFIYDYVSSMKSAISQN